MSVAWTTVALIALLLPGIFFFIGLATYERLSREIIRSGVVSEVAMATMIALVLHTISVVVLSAFGFRLSLYLMPLADYANVPNAVTVSRLSERLLPTVIYIVVTAATGFGLGCLAAYGVVVGWLRFLAMHKWIYDVVDSGRKGRIVTAYVMTTIVEDTKILMYKGRVHEIFLSHDGKISYVILKNCSRFYMNFGADGPNTSKQLELFGSAQGKRNTWDYLLVEGANIANILFDPSAEAIRATSEGEEALRQAIKERSQALQTRTAALARAIGGMQNRGQDK